MKSYVTHDADGNLTGAYLQEVPAEHADAYIEVSDELRIGWPMYRANEVRNGLELIPPGLPPTPTVPQQVTMRQARLALLGAGLLDLVDPAIESLTSPDKEAARIEWDFSSSVERHRPLVAMLGEKLGLTAEQLDELFITAGAL